MKVEGLFSATARHVTRRFGTFDIYVTRDEPAANVPAGLIVLTRGEVFDGERVLCRIASACVTSNTLDSAECECDLQDDAALARIHAEDRGVLIYLTDQEGRGHGLDLKVRALANKNEGMDTFEAVEVFGVPADVRTYGAVEPILSVLGVRSIVLLSGNPDKRDRLRHCGVKVQGLEPLRVAPHRLAQRSLRAKQARGHILLGEYADDPSQPYP